MNEKQRKEKDEILKELQCNAKVMKDKLNKLKNKMIDWSSAPDKTVS